MESNGKLFVILSLIFIAACAPSEIDEKTQPQLELWYEQPAENWNEALPLGNGRLGAMIYGGVSQEHIQFNEETLWTGEPHNYTHEGASGYLREIQQLLFDGKQVEADKLAMEKFMSIPLNQMSYQPFGDLYINFPGHEVFSDYRRSLSLDNAVSHTSYKVNDVTFSREALISKPDQILAMRIEADKDNALEFDLNLNAIHKDKEVNKEGNQLYVKVSNGSTRSGYEYSSVLWGKALLKIETDGKINKVDGNITVSYAKNATIYLTAATNFKNYSDVTNDPDQIIDDIFEKLGNKTYEEVKSSHLSDYKSMYDRFHIDLGESAKSNLPTDKRLEQFTDDIGDPSLIALYVQYGRYLMLASSREGTYPANLQGIWNDKLNPPWESKYTININAEMNYWLSEVGNLSETHDALFNMIDEVVKSGRVTAKEHYGSEGWVVHHNTDIWRGTAPINAANHGIYQGSGGWLSSHLWEHYLYTQDEEFLRNRAYPVMRESALFYHLNLIEDPETGWLVSSPSNSPEIGGLVAGPAMDHQIIRALFKSVIAASAILSVEDDFIADIEEQLPKIAPDQIGQYGQLQEWVEDKDDSTVKHRHVSHLWGIHPGKEINWDETPELMKAAKQSLLFRGDKGTGWSLAWKINFWARLLDGDHAYRMIELLFRPVGLEGSKYGVGGGSYANLFDSHPPFQIDGNFGAPAGILELLMQSHMDRIDLLPALPSALPNGAVSGMKARSGFELSFAWKNGELSSLEVLSTAGKDCKVNYGEQSLDFETDAGKTYRFDSQLKLIE